ncbi:MAG: hypothetical protein WD810_07870 [Solirubrobacterales bacterium]
MDTGAAYLEILKRSLCDLLGYHTFSAQLQPDGSVVPAVLPDDQRERRKTGSDWPLNGTCRSPGRSSTRPTPATRTTNSTSSPCPKRTSAARSSDTA